MIKFIYSEIQVCGFGLSIGFNEVLKEVELLVEDKHWITRKIFGKNQHQDVPISYILSPIILE